MDIILSAATHRSGSTLLQRIFNKRKQTLIWGEQDGVVTKFNRMYNSLKHYSENLYRQRDNYFLNDEDPNQWIACMNPEMEYVDNAIRKSMMVLFDSLYEQYQEGHDMIGFKEVRYGKEELQLLRKCYPEAMIVLLVRNPIDVWKSMLGAGLGQNIGNFTKKWNKHAEEYLDLAKQDPLTYLLKYEDLIERNPETIQNLSQIAYISGSEIEEVLDNKIWSTPRPIAKSTEDFIIKECGKWMKIYGYLA